MKNIQMFSDKAAISFSLLCALHCLLMPVVVVSLPSIAGLKVADEAFHQWMLVAVIPLSVYALTMGCKKHQYLRVLIIGGVGLATMIYAALWGHDVVGEAGEKILTLLGAGLIVLAHIFNYRLCKRSQDCSAH